jgi:hypothetical protein
MTIALADGTSIRIGSHRLTRDGAVATLFARGELTLENTVELLANYQALLDQRGYLLIIIDVAESTGIAMAARKACAEWGKTNGHQCRTAVVGAPFIVRTAIELINRAANLLARRTKEIPLGFFATHEEARQWLAAQVPVIEEAARSMPSKDTPKR